MRRIRTLLGVTPLLGVTLGLNGMLLAPGRAPAAQAAPVYEAEAGTPEGALASFISAQGQAFAGACADTSAPEDIGKVCVRLVEERGGVRAYLAGRTFSEFDRWLFVAQDSAGWTVIADAPLNPSADTMSIPWPSVPARSDAAG